MKRMISVLCILSAFVISTNAQEVKEKVEIKVKEGENNPKIIIDGKEYDFELLDLIDKDKIESVTVLKGEEAIHAYNAENGAIIIQTKVSDNKEELDIAIRKRVKIESKGDDSPVIIIDGKAVDRETLDKLSPEDIESIKIYKSEEAIKKYNSETGVILIVTKKKQ